MELRPATIDDLPALYYVCLRTGDAGDDASDRFDDPDLLGSVYVGPYVVLEGTVAFAGVDIEGVGGYVLAAIDTADFEASCERDWWPGLRERYPLHEPRRSARDHEMVTHIHRPPTMPDRVVERYPAHLHIDLLPRLQGGGHGRTMIETLVAELQRAGASGVHLGVAARNVRAIGFYEHLGFTTLHEDASGRLMGRRW
jgi:ribosomal protein S18 acetylase RimI-like enzyme